MFFDCLLLYQILRGENIEGTKIFSIFDEKSIFTISKDAKPFLVMAYTYFYQLLILKIVALMEEDKAKKKNISLLNYSGDQNLTIEKSVEDALSYLKKIRNKCIAHYDAKEFKEQSNNMFNERQSTYEKIQIVLKFIYKAVNQKRLAESEQEVFYEVTENVQKIYNLLKDGTWLQNNIGKIPSENPSSELS